MVISRAVSICFLVYVVRIPD